MSYYLYPNSQFEIFTLSDFNLLNSELIGSPNTPWSGNKHLMPYRSGWGMDAIIWNALAGIVNFITDPFYLFFSNLVNHIIRLLTMIKEFAGYFNIFFFCI